MSMEKVKLSKRKKQLIYRLNELCFGMHGHLSALLKDLTYFFYFKKCRNNNFSDLYLQSLFFHLKHLVALIKLIEELGGYPKIIEYKNNQIDYYCLKANRKVANKVALFDSIASQKLILNDYLRLKKIIEDEKIMALIDDEIENVKNDLNLFLLKLTTNGEKMLNN